MSTEPEVYRLETTDGRFVADVVSTLPLPPTEVLIWGARMFTRARGIRSVNPPWREVRPTVVQEADVSRA